MGCSEFGSAVALMLPGTVETSSELEDGGAASAPVFPYKGE